MLTDPDHGQPAVADEVVAALEASVWQMRIALYEHHSRNLASGYSRSSSAGSMPWPVSRGFGEVDHVIRGVIQSVETEWSRKHDASSALIRRSNNGRQ